MKYLNDILFNKNESKTIFYKDLYNVELFINELFEKHSSILKDNLMLILLNGKRTLRTKEKTFEGNAGDIFFVKSGTSVQSEVFDDKNISEVCTEVGYSNLSWFIQQFKKEFGITPKQFQKQ